MKKSLWTLLLMGLLFCGMLTGCGDSDQPMVYVYNWGDYIDEDVIDMFEEETGIKVRYEMYDTNEDMYVKVKAGGNAYDVLIPSDYMIEKLLKEDMLLELNYDNIPNAAQTDPKFLNQPYDPDNKYSIPYMWCTLGIIYDSEVVTDPVDTWEVLWNEKYAKEIIMLDSPRDTIGIALKALGYSMNSTNPTELEEAKVKLQKQRSLVLAYLVDQAKEKMASGEAAMAITWSGDALTVMEQNEKLRYSVPQEGSNYSIDAMVIPKTAQNKENAEAFINFMCRPDIALKNTEYIRYSTPNMGAYELLPDEIKNDGVGYPDDSVIEKCEVYIDPGDAIALYDKVWTELFAD